MKEEDGATGINETADDKAINENNADARANEGDEEDESDDGDTEEEVNWSRDLAELHRRFRDTLSADWYCRMTRDHKLTVITRLSRDLDMKSKEGIDPRDLACVKECTELLRLLYTIGELHDNRAPAVPRAPTIFWHTARPPPFH